MLYLGSVLSRNVRVCHYSQSCIQPFALLVLVFQSSKIKNTMDGSKGTTQTTSLRYEKVSGCPRDGNDEVLMEEEEADDRSLKCNPVLMWRFYRVLYPP
jgi:hypothetical protein